MNEGRVTNRTRLPPMDMSCFRTLAQPAAHAIMRGAAAVKSVQKARSLAHKRNQAGTPGSKSSDLQTDLGLRSGERVNDDGLSTTGRPDDHCGVARVHGLVQLDDLVDLHGEDGLVAVTEALLFQVSDDRILQGALHHARAVQT